MIVRVAIAALLCFAGWIGIAGAAAPHLAALQTRSVERGLADDPRWHALVHYERDWLGRGLHSTVASDHFFLAENGRRDPAAELSATLAAFVTGRTIAAREDKPAACVFVARRRFLVERLGLNDDALGGGACDEYRRWRDALNAYRVSLVFPTAFPNSPSSMFGHTLLRIDTERATRDTELLSYAVNFAASAGDDAQGLGFAWKGLTGGYPGVFGLFPYYEKVKQYAWIEHRDVWSYPLQLKATEVTRLVDHLWEMDGVRFDYYFLSKNCSYQLLSLLEAARPELRLTEQYSWYAIPADTIRTLADVPNLMAEPHYRASLETQLRWQAGQLDAAQLALARAIAADAVALDSARLAALPARERAGVLEVAHDYLYYRLQSEPASAPADQAHANAILLARSRIARGSPFGAAPTPTVAPDAGHPTLRVAPALVYEDDTTTLGLRVRPAYHDLLDNPGGYTDGAEINFLDLGLRLDPRDGALRVSDLQLLNIISISPRDDLFKPVSFTLDTGLRRRPSPLVFDAANNNLGYYFQGGPGLAWGDDALLGYVFGLGSIDANSALVPGYALGAGASVGVLAYPRTDVQLKAEAGALEYAAGADGHYRWATFKSQYNLSKSLGLRGELGWENTAAQAGLRATLGLQAYF